MKRHLIPSLLAGVALIAIPSRAQTATATAASPALETSSKPRAGSPGEPAGATPAPNPPGAGDANPFRAGSVSGSSASYNRGGGAPGATAASTGARFVSRMESVVARANPDPGNGMVICSSERSQKEIDEISEDLNVFSFLIQRALQRTVGDKTTDYRLGVPMLLRGEHRMIDASYLEGYGVLVKIHVPFPVASSGQPIEKKPEGASQSEWEKARAAIFGNPADPTNDENGSGEPVRYDEKVVNSLKDNLMGALRNASNLRHVNAAAGETITVAIMGANNSGSNRGTVLTMRVKKSDLDNLVKTGVANPNSKEGNIAQVTQVSAYFDNIVAPSSRGGGAGFVGSGFGGGEGGFGSVGFGGGRGSIGTGGGGGGGNNFPPASSAATR